MADDIQEYLLSLKKTTAGLKELIAVAIGVTIMRAFVRRAR